MTKAQKSKVFICLSVVTAVFAVVILLREGLKQEFLAGFFTKVSPASKVSTAEAPVGWQVISTDHYSIALPADWKYYEYTNGQSFSMCPINDCQDGKFWVEVKYDQLVSNVVNEHLKIPLYKNIEYESLPTELNGHHGQMIRFNQDKFPLPVFAYVQSNKDVIGFGYYEGYDKVDQILSTLRVN